MVFSAVNTTMLIFANGNLLNTTTMTDEVTYGTTTIKVISEKSARVTLNGGKFFSMLLKLITRARVTILAETVAFPYFL